MSLTVLPVFKTKTVHKPYIVLAVFQLIDVASTWIILNYWSVRAEGNPIVAGLLNSVGLTIGMVVLLVFKMSVVYLLWASQTGTKIALTLYAAVILNNLLFIVLWLVS